MVVLGNTIQILCLTSGVSPLPCPTPAPGQESWVGITGSEATAKAESVGEGTGFDPACRARILEEGVNSTAWSERSGESGMWSTWGTRRGHPRSDKGCLKDAPGLALFSVTLGIDPAVLHP